MQSPSIKHVQGRYRPVVVGRRGRDQRAARDRDGGIGQHSAQRPAPATPHPTQPTHRIECALHTPASLLHARLAPPRRWCGWTLPSFRIEHLVSTLSLYGFTRTQIETMQIMWSLLRDNEQVPNVQKSISDQMVRIVTFISLQSDSFESFMQKRLFHQNRSDFT